jgi:chromosome partitioning protein
MIVTWGNQKGGAGETTAALRLGGQTARRSKRIPLFDVDLQGAALVSLEQYTGKRQERLFAVIGLPRSTLRRKASGLVRHAGHVVLTGLLPVAAVMLPAPLAADLAPVRTQPTRFDSCASTGVLGRVGETRVFRPEHSSRFVLSRRPTRSLIAHGATRSLVDHGPLASPSRVGQRMIFAEAARSGQLEPRRTVARRPSSTEIAALIPESEQRARRRHGSATVPSRCVHALLAPEPPESATEAGTIRTAGLAMGAGRRFATASAPRSSSAPRPPQASPA